MATKSVSEKSGGARFSVVPTPIGNLGDITLRGLQVLRDCDTVYCEDTRVTGRLLQHFEIPRKPLVSCNARNEERRTAELIDRLEKGEHVAFCSDAGTPGISDPGARLITAAIQAGIEPEVLPGANALLPALLLSGLTAKTFRFEGFLPQKKGRKTRLEHLAAIPEPTVLYESPYRIVRTLEDLVDACGPRRRASVSREITKMYEETVRGDLESLAAEFGGRDSIKGEFTVILEGNSNR